MDESAAGYTDGEINQISTHGLAEAVWDLENALSAQNEPQYQTTHDQSSLPHSYGNANPSSSSYLSYDLANDIHGGAWKDRCLPSMQLPPPSSSAPPNILSLGYGNQQQTVAKVEFGTELAGGNVHIVSPAGYYYSHMPDLSYAVIGPAAASIPSANRGGDKGGIGGGSSFSQARVEAAGSRPPRAAQDHVVAERKRREKLSERFIALSAIVPGLKKMDKASVLGDAIEYMKQLQVRVQSLEEQAANSTVVVKKSHIPVNDDIASADSNSNDPSVAVIDATLPEVEVEVVDQMVLLRIQCATHKAILVKILAEVERLGLSVVNSRVIPFTEYVLDITIIAEMEEGFPLPVKDIVRGLLSAITQLT